MTASPGPYTVYEYVAWQVAGDGDGCIAIEDLAGTVIAYMKDGEDDDTARLLAAAWEMREHLKKFIARMDQPISDLDYDEALIDLSRQANDARALLARIDNGD